MDVKTKRASLSFATRQAVLSASTSLKWHARIQRHQLHRSRQFSRSHSPKMSYFFRRRAEGGDKDCGDTGISAWDSRGRMQSCSCVSDSEGGGTGGKREMRGRKRRGTSYSPSEKFSISVDTDGINNNRGGSNAFLDFVSGERNGIGDDAALGIGTGWTPLEPQNDERTRRESAPRCNHRSWAWDAAWGAEPVNTRGDIPVPAQGMSTLSQRSLEHLVDKRYERLACFSLGKWITAVESFE